MTLKRAAERLREIHCTISYSVETREYRVNNQGGNEDTAYYTQSLDDAVDTALAAYQLRESKHV